MPRASLKGVFGRLRLPAGAAAAVAGEGGFPFNGPGADAKTYVVLPAALVHKLAEYYGCSLEHVSTAKGHSKRITRMALSPDGQEVATASHDRSIIVWRVNAHGEGWIQETTLLGHERGVLAVCWTPDGRGLVSGGLDCRVICWDLASATPSWTALGHSGTVWGIAVAPCASPGGDEAPGAGIVASTGISDGCIRLWSREDGSARATIPAFRGGVDDVALHPGGRHVVAVGSDRETLFRGAIKVFDMESGQLVRRMQQLHGGLARSVVLSDDGRFVLSSSDEASLNILVHDFHSGALVRSLEGHTAHVRQLCVQGDLLASVSHDHTVRVWKWRAGSCAEVLSHRPGSACVHINHTAGGAPRVRVGDGVCMGAGGRWIAHTTTVALPAMSPRPAPHKQPRKEARAAAPLPIPGARHRETPPAEIDVDVTDSEASSLESRAPFSDRMAASFDSTGSEQWLAFDEEEPNGLDQDDPGDTDEDADDDGDDRFIASGVFGASKPAQSRSRSESMILGWARFSSVSL